MGRYFFLLFWLFLFFRNITYRDARGWHTSMLALFLLLFFLLFHALERQWKNEFGCIEIYRVTGYEGDVSYSSTIVATIHSTPLQ